MLLIASACARAFKIGKTSNSISTSVSTTMAATQTNGANVAYAAAEVANAPMAPARDAAQVLDAQRQVMTTDRDHNSDRSSESRGSQDSDGPGDTRIGEPVESESAQETQKPLQPSDSVLTLVRASGGNCCDHSRLSDDSIAVNEATTYSIPEQPQSTDGPRSTTSKATNSNNSSDRRPHHHHTDRHVAPLASLDFSITESIGMASQISSDTTIIDTPTLSRYFESDHMSDIVDGSLFEITNIGCLSKSLRNQQQQSGYSAYETVGSKHGDDDGGDNQAMKKRAPGSNRVSTSSYSARRSNDNDRAMARDVTDTCNTDASDKHADRLANAIRKEYETSKRIRNDQTATRVSDSSKKAGKRRSTCKRGFKFNLFSFLGVGHPNESSSGDSSDGDDVVYNANDSDCGNVNDNEYQSVQQQKQQVKQDAKHRTAEQCTKRSQSRQKRPESVSSGRSQVPCGQRSRTNQRHRPPGRSTTDNNVAKLPTKNVRDSIKLTNQRKLRSSSSSRPNSKPAISVKSNELLLNLSSSPSKATGAADKAIRASHSAYCMDTQQSPFSNEPSRNRASSHSACVVKPAKSVKFTTPDEVLILPSPAVNTSCFHQARANNQSNGHTFVPPVTSVNGRGNSTHLSASADLQPVVPIIKRSSLPKSSSYSQTDSNKTLDELLAKYESNQDLVRAINEKLHLSETIASPLSAVDDVMFVKKCSPVDVEQRRPTSQQRSFEDEAASINRLSALNDATRYQLWQQQKSDQNYYRDHASMVNGTDFEPQRISATTNCEAFH